MSSVETTKATNEHKTGQPTSVAAPKKKKAAPKKAPATKGAKKKAKAAPVKKAPVKKKAKGTKKAAKKEGLRKPQVRILSALDKANRALNRSEVATKSEVDEAMLNSYMGAHDPTIRAKNDKRFYPSLLTLGLIKTSAAEEEGHGVYYKITAAGSTAVAKTKEEAKATK